MKLFFVSSLLLSLVAVSANAAPGIDTGCFRYGPNNCDQPGARQPSMDTGGFRYGPVVQPGVPAAQPPVRKK